MKKNMVIHCASGICNSGDEAILSVLLEQYYNEFNIVVISLNCENTKRYYPEINCVLNGSPQCKEHIQNCDIFILGGGGLIQDQTTIFNVFRWLKYLKFAIRLNKRTMIYANSIGPLNHRLTRKYVKTYLNKVNLITLRDCESKQLLDSIGILTHSEITADPVFSMKNVCASNKLNGNAMKLQENLPPKYICVALRHWFDTIPFLPVSLCTKLNLRTAKNVHSYEHYIKTMTQIIYYCIETTKLPVVFTSFLPERDSKVAKDIVKHLPENHPYLIITEDITPYSMMQIIGNSHFLIGMRLHSLIYAIAQKTPFIAINYSTKVEAILKYMNLQEYALDITNLSFEDFIRIFQDFNYDLVHQKMEKALELMQEKEKNNCILLYEMLKEG